MSAVSPTSARTSSTASTTSPSATSTAPRRSPTAPTTAAPLPYSFSEAGHTKSLTLVNLTPGTAPTVTRLPCPTPTAWNASKAPSRTSSTTPTTKHSRTPGSRSPSPTRPCPSKPWPGCAAASPTLSLKHQRAFIPTQATDTPTYTERLQGRTELDIACDFITDLRGSAPTPDEHALLQQAVDAARVNETQKETV
ncbi:hypothetical protein SHKM778_95540 (plasmid) [Streptomyces sp. KM77-8]|uniref:Uncharacterized protein n=1 Tax=Streptomyces haneummycinicus TaxID=3074435 RepID=A0AAT9I0B6_9ACTN